MYIATGYCQIDRLHSVRLGIGCQGVETELVKVLELKYPTISYTNKLYEGNKKTLLTQTLHRKTLKLLFKIKKKIRLRRATNLASIGKLLQSYFMTIIRTLDIDTGIDIDIDR